MRRLETLALFLLAPIASIAQVNWDTLHIDHFYQTDPPTYLYTFTPDRKLISYFDAKGRLLYVKGFKFSANNSNPFFFYQETYKYGSNDALLTVHIDEANSGQDKLWPKEFQEYFYKGNQIQEVKTIKYFFYRKSINDTSGWTIVSATRYSYDDQDRLVKKAYYKDYADKSPVIMWLYSYDNELPDLNSYFQNTPLLKTVYNHLYNKGKLVLYRVEDNTEDGNIEVDNSKYTYNKEGLADELVTSEVIYTSKKIGGPYKKGKEDINGRYEYKYTDGKLTSETVHYRESYKKYKVKFLDAMGRMPSYSSSTTRYGDYETRTTTVTPNNSPPPRKEDMKEKTKYKWHQHTREYEYVNGTRFIKGSSRNGYDSKGRVISYQTCVGKDLYDGQPTCVRYRYGYRN